MIMTPHQVLAVAALLGLVLFVAVAVALHHLVARLIDRYEDHRARRTPTDDEPPAAADDLDTCRAIDALGTTSHPADD